MTGTRLERKKGPTNTMPCPCWCEREFVRLTAQQIFDGVTLSCGHPECVDPRATDGR